ncbi:glyoxalase, partial [Pseudonocardia sp. KRD-169]|nr:glyoxalase [Pseudonocardia abyssalis]
LVLGVEGSHATAGRLRAAGTAFVIEPYPRFAGEPGEQWTLFLLDPAGNTLEFTAFADPAQLFAS